MVNVINKTVGFILNPLFVGMLIIAAAFVLALHRKRKAVMWTLGIGLLWFWFWSMPIVGGWLALPLERDYPVQLAKDMPTADAIVLMGGGIWGVTNYPYAMLKDGADRVWHAARLWKAGKAPIIIPSNVDAELCDVKLLVDLGVSREAVVLENKAVNSEENAKFVRDILTQRRKGAETAEKLTVLLVTSACHMSTESVHVQEICTGDRVYSGSNRLSGAAVEGRAVQMAQYSARNQCVRKKQCLYPRIHWLLRLQVV